jgi:hypothetical protein
MCIFNRCYIIIIDYIYDYIKSIDKNYSKSCCNFELTIKLNKLWKKIIKQVDLRIK